MDDIKKEQTSSETVMPAVKKPQQLSFGKQSPRDNLNRVNRSAFKTNKNGTHK